MWAQWWWRGISQRQYRESNPVRHISVWPEAPICLSHGPACMPTEVWVLHVDEVIVEPDPCIQNLAVCYITLMYTWQTLMIMVFSANCRMLVAYEWPHKWHMCMDKLYIHQTYTRAYMHTHTHTHTYTHIHTYTHTHTYTYTHTHTHISKGEMAVTEEKCKIKEQLYAKLKIYVNGYLIWRAYSLSMQCEMRSI
jgi:hypothetical protein